MNVPACAGGLASGWNLNNAVARITSEKIGVAFGVVDWPQGRFDAVPYPTMWTLIIATNLDVEAVQPCRRFSGQLKPGGEFIEMLFRFVKFLLIGLRLITSQSCDLLRNLKNRVTNAAHAGNLAGNTVRRETGRDENGRRPKPPCFVTSASPTGYTPLSFRARLTSWCGSTAKRSLCMAASGTSTRAARLRSAPAHGAAHF